MYWTDDALGRLSVAGIHSPAHRVLVSEPHFHPRALTLDPANGYAAFYISRCFYCE